MKHLSLKVIFSVAFAALGFASLLQGFSKAGSSSSGYVALIEDDDLSEIWVGANNCKKCDKNGPKCEIPPGKGNKGQPSECSKLDGEGTEKCQELTRNVDYGFDCNNTSKTSNCIGGTKTDNCQVAPGGTNCGTYSHPSGGCVYKNGICSYSSVSTESCDGDGC